LKLLKKLIENYCCIYPNEKAPIDMLEYLKTKSNVFSKTNYNGHFTGSGWVVNNSRNQILMTHHKKIGKWLQLGGHADGESNLILVAKREVYEESGLTKLNSINEEIFDLDIHTIPALSSEPSHIHYDVRFLFEASSESEKITVSNESLDVAWVPIENVVNLNPEKSIDRMIRKTKLLKK